MRPLRFFAAIPLASHVVYATDLAVTSPPHSRRVCNSDVGNGLLFGFTKKNLCNVIFVVLWQQWLRTVCSFEVLNPSLAARSLPRPGQIGGRGVSCNRGISNGKTPPRN